MCEHTTYVFSSEGNGMTLTNARHIPAENLPEAPSHAEIFKQRSFLGRLKDRGDSEDIPYTKKHQQGKKIRTWRGCLGIQTGWDHGQRCGHRADGQRERLRERPPRAGEGRGRRPGPRCLSPATAGRERTLREGVGEGDLGRALGWGRQEPPATTLQSQVCYSSSSCAI